MTIGSFTFTRESLLWWVGLVAAIVTGLATLDADTAINTFGIPAWWLPRLRLASLLVGIGSAWMKTSPFPSKKDVNSETVDPRHLVSLVLLVLALGASACATLGRAKPIAAITVVSADAVLSAIQDTEMGLVCGRPSAPPAPACVPLERHREINAHLATAFSVERRIAPLVKALPDGAPTTEVDALLRQIRELVASVLALIPDSAPRRTLIGNIGGRS